MNFWVWSRTFWKTWSRLHLAQGLGSIPQQEDHTRGLHGGGLCDGLRILCCFGAWTTHREGKCAKIPATCETYKFLQIYSRIFLELAYVKVSGLLRLPVFTYITHIYNWVVCNISTEQMNSLNDFSCQDDTVNSNPWSVSLLGSAVLTEGNFGVTVESMHACCHLCAVHVHAHMHWHQSKCHSHASLFPISVHRTTRKSLLDSPCVPCISFPFY